MLYCEACKLDMCTCVSKASTLFSQHFQTKELILLCFQAVVVHLLATQTAWVQSSLEPDNVILYCVYIFHNSSVTHKMIIFRSSATTPTLAPTMTPTPKFMRNELFNATAVKKEAISTISQNNYAAYTKHYRQSVYTDGYTYGVGTQPQHVQCAVRLLIRFFFLLPGKFIGTYTIVRWNALPK